MNVNLNTITSELPLNQISPSKRQSPKGLKWTVRHSNGELNPLPSDAVRQRLNFDGVDDKSVIYRIKHRDTNQRYVGSCYKTETNTFTKRLYSYKTVLNHSGGHNQYIINAIKCHKEHMEFKILETFDDVTEQELHKIEEKWQDFFCTRNRKYGYNITRPTQEHNRAGPRKPRDPTKIRAVPMKKPALPPREQSQRKAAAVAREILKTIS